MKKTLLLLLFISASLSAQIVNIPDVNFKNKLLQASVSNGIAKNQANQNIAIDTNSDGEIQQSEALAVYGMNVSNSMITSLQGIEYFSNLKYLACIQNQLTSLDVSMLTSLTILQCYNNQLTVLNFPDTLINLSCHTNQLTSLNLTGLNSLQILQCDSNQLTTLAVSGLVSLNSLSCGSNPISEINLEGLSNLQYFTAINLPLTNLNTSGLLSLEQIYISGSLLTEVDLSGSPLLVYYNINNNQYLTYINIKNGTNIEYPLECYIANNPALELICVDEGEDAIMLQNPDYANIPMSSDCGSALIPYNTITGHLGFDLNGSGCDANDNSPYFVKVKLFDGTSARYRFTNNAGNYIFITEEGNYTVTPIAEHPFFDYSPNEATTNFPAVDGSVFTQDFCLTANGIHPDIEIYILPLDAAQPGFNAKYHIGCHNRGNQTLSGTFTFNFDDAILDYVESNPASSSTGAGTVTWEFNNLLPFQYTSAHITLAINAPTDIPAVVIGDVLSYSAEAIVENDANPADNTFICEQTVVGSQDPNNIACLEGATAPVNKIGDYLHYTINFENIGTAAANFVIITEGIDSEKYDVSSVEIIDSSHEVDASLDDNTLQFNFNDINLEPQAHGSVTFKIKTLPTLQANDAVMSQASIVFDFNEAIVTNEAVTTFQTLGTKDFGVDAVKVYPNPATNVVTVQADAAIKTVSLYDIQGRLLYSATVNNATAIIDISARAAGVYFIKTASDNGITTEKVIKK